MCSVHLLDCCSLTWYRPVVSGDPANIPAQLYRHTMVAMYPPSDIYDKSANGAVNSTAAGTDAAGWSRSLDWGIPYKAYSTAASCASVPSPPPAEGSPIARFVIFGGYDALHSQTVNSLYVLSVRERERAPGRRVPPHDLTQSCPADLFAYRWEEVSVAEDAMSVPPSPRW
jgi:hypothetical protein